MGTNLDLILSSPTARCLDIVRDVNAILERDLDALRKLAYKREEKVGPLLKEIHAIRAARPQHPDLTVLEIIRRWLLTPFTLWPVDFVGIGAHVVSVVQNGRRLRPEIRFVIEQIAKLPSPTARGAVAAHERKVEKGRYEVVVAEEARTKFREKAKEVSQDPEFRREWKRLQALFDVQKYRDSKGIIRRRMVQERNFRPDWRFENRGEKCRFQAAFDAFCHRWNLYGMEGNKPLVLKLSVNLTAHGTMIVVPAFWSFDPKRDLDWNTITELHRARGVTRQGPKLSVGRIERKKLARRAHKLWAESGRKRLRGEERYVWIKQQLKLPDSFTNREIRRLRTEAERAKNHSKSGGRN